MLEHFPVFDFGIDVRTLRTPPPPKKDQIMGLKIEVEVIDLILYKNVEKKVNSEEKQIKVKQEITNFSKLRNWSGRR